MPFQSRHTLSSILGVGALAVFLAATASARPAFPVGPAGPFGADEPAAAAPAPAATAGGATAEAAAPVPRAVHPFLADVASPAPEPSAGGGSPGGPDDDDWTGNVSVYGFLTSFDGQLRARGTTVDVNRSFGDITDVLKFAAGVRVEAQHGRWGFAADNNYMHVGDDVTTDRLISPDYRFDLALNVTEFEGTYRLYRTGEQDDPVGGPKFAIDALGGVRIAHLSTDLEIRRIIADDTIRDASATYVHGYLGNRIVASPSKYVSLIGRYNLSLASDFSWFVSGMIEIQPWEHVAFDAGIQVLDLSLEKDSTDAALDARLFGPVVALKFIF